MDRLATLLAKGIGVFVLLVVVLGVVATIVGIAFSIVATVFSIAVTIAVLGVIALALIGLASLVGGDSATDRRSETEIGVGRDDAARGRDPESRLREKYVAGELSEAEFERELDRVLEDDPPRRGSGGRSDADRSRDLDRSRR